MNFEQDNPVVAGWTRLADIAILSVLWVVFSLPLFTLGTSSSALYYATVRGVRQSGTGSAARLFIGAFKANFRQATPYMLVVLLLCAAFTGTIWFFAGYDMGVIGLAYRVLSLGLMALVAMFAVHLFPLIGRFRMDRRNLLTASLTLIRIGFFRTLGLLVLLAGLNVICVYYPPCLLIAAGTYAYVATLIQEPLFKRIIRFEDPLDGDTPESEAGAEEPAGDETAE